jgi:hypothetical protein
MTKETQAILAREIKVAYECIVTVGICKFFKDDISIVKL